MRTAPPAARMRAAFRLPPLSPPLRRLLSTGRRPAAPRCLSLSLLRGFSTSALPAATLQRPRRQPRHRRPRFGCGQGLRARHLFEKNLVRASSSGSRPGASAFAALASTSASPGPALGVLVIALSQMALLDEALSVFGRLRQLPALPACNAILDGLLKAQRFARVWELFDQMLGRGMVPSVVTYNTLINACRHQGDAAKAWKVWDQMATRRIDPNVVTYTMICALCEDDCIGAAERLFVAMKKTGLQPNLYTYNALMSSHFKRYNIDHAFVFYYDLLKGGFVPNDVIFTTLIDGLCQANRISEAKNIFLDMARYEVAPTVPVYNSLINGAFRSGNTQEALDFYQEMARKGLCPDEFTCSIVVRGLCDVGQVQVAARFLEVMQQSDIALNAAAYNVLIDEYCKNGNLDEALATCTRMSEVGVEPSVVTYSSLIDGHAKEGKMQIAMAIFTEMVAKGVEPNVITYKALIHGHAKHGEIDAGFGLWKEMKEKCISPNTITVSVLVYGLCRENRVQDAVRFVIENSRKKYADIHSFLVNSTSEENPSIANSVTYMTLVYGLYIDGQYHEACHFFYYMRESGMVPDSFTYTLVIRGQCMLGYVLNAMMLYADMIKIGVKPTRYAMVYPDIW